MKGRSCSWWFGFNSSVGSSFVFCMYVRLYYLLVTDISEKCDDQLQSLWKKYFLTTSNAECMDRTSKLYAYYGYLRQFSTTVTVVPDDTATLGDHSNLIETWNRIRLDTLLNNVNMTWGGQVIYWRQSSWNPRHDYSSWRSYWRIPRHSQQYWKKYFSQALEKHNDGLPCSIILEWWSKTSHHDPHQNLRALQSCHWKKCLRWPNNLVNYFSNNAREWLSQLLQRDWIHERCYLGKLR